MLKKLIKLNISILFTIILDFNLILAAQATQSDKQYKIFMVTGESSAEQIGAWYLEKRIEENPNLYCKAIGGQSLENLGAKLYDKYENLILGYVSPIQFIKHIPDRWYYLKDLSDYILENNFDEVVLIDCPLTNIPLMRILKKNKPGIQVTYIAPPEMWLWGKWGMDYFFRKYADHIIVVYPFEVEWYKKNELETEFLGWPGYEKIEPSANKIIKKQNKIALCPGSRKSEIKIMLPIFLKTAQIISEQHPEISFILPIAKYISKGQIETEIKKYNLENKVKIIKDNENIFDELSSCCLAVSKPGTITLILALLKVPTVIAVKIPLITYFIAKMIFQKSYVGLPNLFLEKEVFKELIQSECTTENITKEIEKLYETFKNNQQSYQQKLKELEEIQNILQQK